MKEAWSLTLNVTFVGFLWLRISCESQWITELGKTKQRKPSYPSEKNKTKHRTWNQIEYWYATKLIKFMASFFPGIFLLLFLFLPPVPLFSSFTQNLFLSSWKTISCPIPWLSWIDHGNADWSCPQLWCWKHTFDHLLARNSGKTGDPKQWIRTAFGKVLSGICPSGPSSFTVQNKIHFVPDSLFSLLYSLSPAIPLSF